MRLRRYAKHTFMLTPLELQSRFGDTPAKFQVVCPKLSPKRDCGSKRVNGNMSDSYNQGYARVCYIIIGTLLERACQQKIESRSLLGP